MLTTSFGSTKKTMKQRLKNLFDHSVKRQGIVAFCAVIGLTAVLCGTIAYTPVLAAESNVPSQTAQTYPGGIRFSSNDGSAVRFGSYSMSKQQQYFIAVRWDEGGKRPLYCIEETSDGKEGSTRYEYEITSEIPLFVTVPRDGSYRFVIPEGAQMTNIVCTVDVAEADTSGSTMKTTKIGNEVWYLVETESQLRSIMTNADTLSHLYLQNANIQVASVWTSIGDDQHPFTGRYNGNGFVISGLRYQENENKYRGLFGYSENAEMYNITIAGLGTGPVVTINIGGKGAYDNAIISQEEFQRRSVLQEKQAISFDAVGIRQYDNGDPYIYDIITNNTDRTITAYEHGMLAFDQNGQPLKLHWNGWDSSAVPSYYFLYDWGNETIPARQGRDVFGGWSLQKDQSYRNIAYVLYNFKQITFEDGTVWENPEYKSWLKTYEGKQTDPQLLNGYYPLSCVIE